MGSGSPPALGPGRRCARHALATAPDGLCVLCRSASLPPPRPYPTWVLGGLLLAILLVSGGALAYRAVAGFTHAAIAQEPSSPQRAVSAARAAPVVSEQPAAPVADPVAPPLAQAGDSVPLTESIPEPAAPALAAPPAATAAAPPTSEAPTRPPPTPAEVQAALSATPIVMYSASWCGVCRKAKRFLAENGLRYQEIDADETPGAWGKIEGMTGHRGVPVIIVDGELTPAGLRPSNIMRAVAHSMERRLGVTGIRFKTN